MIKYTPACERKFSLVRTPYEQNLLSDNPWVQMEAVVPWDELAKIFFKSMSSNKGRASVDLRLVIGAMLVKHIEGLSDEDTIRYIQENIYTQFFVGLPTFQAEPLFVPSLFVEIRKRLGPEGAMHFNDLLLQHAERLGAIMHKPKSQSEKGMAKAMQKIAINQGRMLKRLSRPKSTAVKRLVIPKIHSRTEAP